MGELEKTIYEEYEKLSDLEFDLKILLGFTKDEAQIILASSKVKRQMQKIEKLESQLEALKTSSKEQKESDEENIKEESNKAENEEKLGLKGE